MQKLAEDESPQWTLPDLLDDCWNSLVEGARRGKHPFHTGVLGSIGPSGVALRTVVLRAVHPERRTLILHSDARAAKLEQLRCDPRVSWLFYDPRRRVQLRLEGLATVHEGDEVAHARWRNSPARARRCYGVEPAPGTAVHRPTSGLTPELVERAPSLEESDPWVDRFAVIVTEARSLEWLRLRARGHLRARFEWHGDRLVSSWLVP
jgi:3-hydroxyisobutyrate dehydrogenase